MEKLTQAEFHERLKAQGVGYREDYAFSCPSCGTVQSMRMLRKYGATAEEAENKVGFSCVGRLSGAGPFLSKKPLDPEKPGCDWTLGGLLRIHRLEVTTDDGKVHPTFELASPEEAQELRQELLKEEECLELTTEE